TRSKRDWSSDVCSSDLQKWTRKNSTPCPDRSSLTRMWKRSKLPRSLCCVRQAATLKYTCSTVLPPWILPLVQSSFPVVAPTPMTRSMIWANQQGRCCWNMCTVGRKLHWVTRSRTKHSAIRRRCYVPVYVKLKKKPESDFSLALCVPGRISSLRWVTPNDLIHSFFSPHPVMTSCQKTSPLKQSRQIGSVLRPFWTMLSRNVSL